MDNSKLLVLKNLSVWYTRDKPVLDNLSMELGANEVVGLIGLNGAGKTTFIKTLSGLLDSFQIETALWQDKPLKFRDRDFKKDRYTAFAEDHSFQFFSFREYASYVAASYSRKLSDIDELIHGFHFEEYTDILLKELSTGNLSSHILESICLTSDWVAVLEQGQIKRCFAGQEIRAEKIREVLKE